jgi:hypothetical protein
MRAAGRFVRLLDEEGLLPSVGRVRAELFGSLGATGRGHGSDKGSRAGQVGKLTLVSSSDTAHRRFWLATSCDCGPDSTNVGYPRIPRRPGP